MVDITFFQPYIFACPFVVDSDGFGLNWNSPKDEEMKSVLVQEKMKQAPGQRQHEPVSSGAADLALENLSAYCSAKAALNHFTKVLSIEEPELTCLALRPGMVDTDLQTDIRELGRTVMTSGQMDFYKGFKDRDELIPPQIPAKSIAWLAAAAPARFSGGFYDADDPDIVAQADTFFGSISNSDVSI